MPKINVYLPDDLASAVRAAGVPVSPVCQRALSEAVRRVTLARQAVAAMRDPAQDPSALIQRLIEAGDRITPRLGDSMQAAQRAAREDHVLSTAHLLLGILEQGDNLAVRVLRASEVDTDDLREVVRNYATTAHGGDREGANTAGGGANASPSSIWAGMTPGAREALAAAFESAIEHAHNYVGCEHLLLGLAACPNDAAGKALAGFGIDATAVRRAVDGALAGFVHARTTDLSSVVRRLDDLERRLNALR